MRDTIFHICDRRHKWVLMREYKIVVLFRCRVCKKISRGFKYESFMVTVWDSIRPKLIKNLTAPNPLMRFVRSESCKAIQV